MRIGLVVLAGLSLLSVAVSGQVPAIGGPAPEFSLRTLDGAATRLSDYRGRAVVVNFWASWCAPCRTELPELVSAYQANRARGLVVLAINLTDQERRKDVAEFAQGIGLPFPVLLDERGQVRERYRLTTVPTTLFLDSLGTLRDIHPGAMSPRGLERRLAAILPP